jgi:CRP-like cAMP-binding protein
VCPFRFVADEDLEQLDREITLSEAATGSTLFEQGDRADGVSAILEGEVEVIVDGKVLATLGPGIAPR